ncbi:hypothetical protein QQ054_32420 [Oscillatoria amoena NRMC-F 0135]|nr:hypothetical protein [Oscillatoria amoena NRMC-F 0135]
MRTTLTLDIDIYREIRQEALKRNTTPKKVINDLLRKGLRGNSGKKSLHLPAPKNMGVIAGLNYDNVGELLARVEGENYR